MILAIIQARSSSSRFPRKVLEPILGMPMILRQFERLAASKELDRIIVATSDETSDDELTRVLNQAGVEVRRGPLNDVLARFALIINDLKPSHTVRLTADCPLADPEVVDRVVQDHLHTGGAYTSNVHPPTYPDGLDVEVFSAHAFDILRNSALSSAEREHVTLGFLNPSRGFSIHNVKQDTNYSDLRWTVDLPEDLEFVRAVYKHLYSSKPDFRQTDILALLKQQPELVRTAKDVPRNAGMRRDESSEE